MIKNFFRKIFCDEPTIYKNTSDIVTLTEAVAELGDATTEDIKDLEFAIAELGDEVARLAERLGE